MSADEIRRLYLDNQRETIRQQYKFKSDLLALTRAGAKVVYANQEEAANKIIANFMSGKIWVVLVAQPGVGKTGTILEVLRQFGQHGSPEWQSHIDDMLLLTGMSDTEWRKTMADGTLETFQKIIRDRSMFRRDSKFTNNLSAMRNGLIITDECHVAAQEGQTISNVLKNAGLATIDGLKERNMRMLDVSATPEGVLHDLRRWREDTAVVVLDPDDKYKGFQSMKNDGRLLNSKEFNLEKQEDAHRLLKIFDDRYKECPTKKYFAFRISSDASRGNIRNACLRLGWDHENHDSKDRVEDIDAVMEKPPTKHKVFFVKGFWRASKRIVRKHVGGSYEAPTIRADDTSKSQGLTARFCSTFDWDGEQVVVGHRPLHFDDLESINRYLEWTRVGYDYTQAAYMAPRLRSDGEGAVKHPRTKAADAGSVVVVEEDPAPASVVAPSRVRGAACQVPVVEMTRYYACTPETFRVVARQAVAEAVQSLRARAVGHANEAAILSRVEDLKSYTPKNPFTGEPDAAGHYLSAGLGDREPVAHSRDEVFLQRRAGFSMNCVTTRRVTACYDGDSPVGFVIRYVTGENEVATTP
jgi:hypothetical protein